MNVYRVSPPLSSYPWHMHPLIKDQFPFWFDETEEAFSYRFISNMVCSCTLNLNFRYSGKKYEIVRG